MQRRIAVLFIPIALATAAFGQKKDKAPAERTVTGVVINDAGEAIAGAIVQLKNTKTLQVRSFIAKDKGEYFFHGLSTDVDYEITAEWNGKASNKRVISSFDSHPALTMNLTIK
jgi:hypothetical protein